MINLNKIVLDENNSIKQALDLIQKTIHDLKDKTKKFEITSEENSVKITWVNIIIEGVPDEKR